MSLKLKPTGPSSAQVRPKLGPIKWAAVRPNLRPRTAKFDSRQLLVGPSRPASFLFVLFPAAFVAKRLEYWIYISKMSPTDFGMEV